MIVSRTAEISISAHSRPCSQQLGESRSIVNADRMHTNRRLMERPATKISGTSSTASREKCAMGKLQGKVAVITRGTQRNGPPPAKNFPREGAHVFFNRRPQRELEEAVASLGPNGPGVWGGRAHPG